MRPIRILLQTTIQPSADDWSIERFGLLRAYLDGLRDGRGDRLCEVTARDRATPGGKNDPLLSTLDRTDYDELWLFAVDVGEGLNSDECSAIRRFRARGNGLMVSRDHMDLGSCVCALGGVGAAHHFHSRNPNPDESCRRIDDPFTTAISWPNYHSGANGDFQEMLPEGAVHPLLADAEGSGATLRYLPAHPHEGDVGRPPGDPSARVIATGRSKATGTRFNIAVAFEPVEGAGPAVAQSTFHHFCDYNWDPRAGCPSFVTEPPGDGMLTRPEALRQTHAYVRNLALWLAGRSGA